MKPFALEPLETYIFTISGQAEISLNQFETACRQNDCCVQVNVSNGTADLVLENVVSAEVEVVRQTGTCVQALGESTLRCAQVLGDLIINYYGGTGFSSRRHGP